MGITETSVAMHFAGSFSRAKRTFCLNDRLTHFSAFLYEQLFLRLPLSISFLMSYFFIYKKSLILPSFFSESRVTKNFARISILKNASICIYLISYDTAENRFFVKSTLCITVDEI